MVNCIIYIMLGNTAGKYVYHYSVYIHFKECRFKKLHRITYIYVEKLKGNQGNDKIQDSSYFWKYERKYVIKEAHCVS